MQNYILYILKLDNILKLVRLYTFIKCLSFYLLKIKIKSFPKPPSEILKIGFFDKNHNIHVSDQYRSFFTANNLHKGDDYTHYKPDIIDLVLVEETVLIKKTYKGSLKNRMKFFNEIDCLYRLNKLRNIPKIYFIDYENLIIYVEYIKGDCLHMILGHEKGLSESSGTMLKECCIAVLKKIHENNLAVIDIQPQNIIYRASDKCVVFIDFADSVCAGIIPGKILRFLQKFDESLLSERVLDKLQN